MSATQTALLAFREVCVDYPGVKALDSVSFEVKSHEVHALVGENGAGKSTLLKVLAGAHSPSAGSLLIEGRKCVFRSTREALTAGICVIYQELNLVPQLSVAENLLLGQLPQRAGFVSRQQLTARASTILRELGEEIDPNVRLGALPPGLRQMVEIGKALLRDARIIAFDEPTSSLSARETDSLKRIIRSLKAAGRAIIYVTHRLEEVFELCDSATVLRDGACVARHPDIRRLSSQRLVEDLVGRRIEDVYGYRPRAIAEPLLVLDRITGPGLSAPVSLTVRRGEILGLFGLVGAGRTELIRLVCGARQRSGGSMAFNGRAVCYRDPRTAIRDGIALCPEDRKAEGIFPVASVADNLNISARRHHAHGRVFVNRRKEAAVADEYISRLRVRTPDRNTAIGSLSGGNQQKVILARWLAERIDLLIVDEPTRGIDVGARSEIYAILYDLAQAGRAVVVVSSDLPEVLGICDRIGVMRAGALVGILPRSEASPQAALRLALPD